jgi:hypothetical protein
VENLALDEKATAMTSEEWLSSVLQHVSVAASYSRTVLSSDANATSCSSDEKATALTDQMKGSRLISVYIGCSQ